MPLEMGTIGAEMRGFCEVGIEQVGEWERGRGGNDKLGVT